MEKCDQPPSYSEVMKETSAEHAANTCVENINQINAYVTASDVSNYAQPNTNPYQGHIPQPTSPLPHSKGKVHVSSYGSIPPAPTTINMPTEIIVVGGCPACRIGVLETDYPFIGWACAICFFPLGVLFCLAMKQKRCTHCGAEF